MATKGSGDGSPDGPPSLSLASAFPDASDDAWRAMVKRILRGRPYEETLITETYDGIAIQPLYTADDWPAEGDPSGFPGMPPFTRGQRLTGRAAGGWDICQLHANPDRSASNDAIRRDLQRGVTSILLRFDRAGQAGLDSDTTAAEALGGPSGVMVACIDDLDELLDGTDLANYLVALDAGAAFLPAAAILIALWRKRDLPFATVRGAFNADPLGALAANGSLPSTIEQALRALADLADYTARNLPRVQSIGVDTRAYHNAGGSEAQELACAMATGVAYLRAATDNGMDPESASAQFVFTFSSDADFLLTMAKLRAARRLWGRVAEACGVGDAIRRMRIHAVTSERMLSRRDPWVNMLRATVSGFASAIGGADRITVLPFNSPLGLPDAFARRIARNTQLVLQEESSLNRVIDPAGGAWAVESLTDALAEEAWQGFQSIEAGGGMPTVLVDGSLASEIAEVAAARQRNIAMRSDSLIGLSDFANLFEQPVPVVEPDLAALRADAADRLREVRRRAESSAASVVTVSSNESGERCLSSILVAAADNGATIETLAAATRGSTGTQIDPLPSAPLGAAFETLRDASDDCLNATGSRPTVFLAVIGTAAQYSNRASFAVNLLAAGGVDAVMGEGGLDIDAITAGFKASGIAVAVICSDDAVYARIGVSLAKALRQAGARELYAVGTPQIQEAELSAAPVDGMMFQGCDVLGILTDIHERMRTTEQ